MVSAILEAPMEHDGRTRENEATWDKLWNKLSWYKGGMENEEESIGYDYSDPSEDMYLDKIVEHGIFSDSSLFEDDLPEYYELGDCHNNAVRFIQSDLSEEGDRITVGYVLVMDNWVQHTYISNKDNIAVEVTHGVYGTAYYGYILSEEEETEFIKIVEGE